MKKDAPLFVCATDCPAISARYLRLVKLGYRRPVCTEISFVSGGAQDPEDAVEDATIIHPMHTTRLVRQHWLDGSPLVVVEFVAHDFDPLGFEVLVGTSCPD